MVANDKVYTEGKFCKEISLRGIFGREGEFCACCIEKYHKQQLCDEQLSESLPIDFQKFTSNIFKSTLAYTGKNLPDLLRFLK